MEFVRFDVDDVIDNEAPPHRLEEVENVVLQRDVQLHPTPVHACHAVNFSIEQ